MCRRASATWPSSPSWMVTLAWPSIRVTGSMTIVCDMNSFLSAKAQIRFPIRLISGNQIRQYLVYSIGRGGTSRDKNIHGDHFMHGAHAVQQAGDNGAGRRPGDRDCVDKSAIDDGSHAERI